MLELRCADRPPIGYEFAPVAFWVGLLTDDDIRNNLLELFHSWSDQDRKIAIRNADYLDLKTIGPQNKSMFDWINYFSDLALSGLSNRSNLLAITAETDLLIPYLELFQKKGVPAEFLQHNYLKRKKPLIEFLKEHI